MPPKEWQPSRCARHRLRAKSGALTAGWATNAGVLVVALFDGELLPNALARLHGAGYGSMARVLDAGRGDMNLQLHRLGIDTNLGLPHGGPTCSLLVVQAAGRSDVIGDLLLSAGATDVRIVTRDRASDLPVGQSDIATMHDHDAEETT